MKPYLASSVLAGFKNGERYLASVDMYGLLVQEKFVATNFASYMVKSIVDTYWKENMVKNYFFVFFFHHRFLSGKKHGLRRKLTLPLVLN